MSWMYGIYVGIKKLLPLTIFTNPAVGWSDISLQRPTSTNTTIANHGCHQQKWPPSTPHEALRSMTMLWMDGQKPPKQVNIILGAVAGEYGPQNILMLWQCIIAGAKGRFIGHTHHQPPPKIISHSSGGYHPSIQSNGTEFKASCGALGGHFCWWQPWLWRLWCQLWVVLRYKECNNNILKLVVCDQYLYLLLYIVKHI